nr:IclR family transcriptional regulator C-terminal domain-containing protein [Enterocloster clostridioformis]
MLWISFLRSQDYAVDDEEIALGVRCIATPIYDYRGVVNYILGISGTTNNIKPFSMDRYLSALLSASSQISSALGYKHSRQSPEVQPPGPHGDSGRKNPRAVTLGFSLLCI